MRLFSKKMSKLNLSIRYLVSSIVCFLIFNSAFADDAGITKVQLIQQIDTSYIFEADVPQIILSSIKKPLLPERFTYTDFELNNQSGWITLKTVISTSGSPFNKDDEILLPWLRNGVDFTAQWKDGKPFKGLFNLSLNLRTRSLVLSSEHSSNTQLLIVSPTFAIL